MKRNMIYLMGFLILLAACQKDLLLEERGEGLLPSSLSDKPSILRLSFIEEVVRRAEFPEGSAEEFGLTYLEEPKSERKQIYLEVYYDFTFSKQVEYLTTNSKFPADQWKLPNDMPQLKKTTYSNGKITGYDASNNVIYEDTYEQQLWINPEEFQSIEMAREFVIASYYNPKSVKDRLLDNAKINASNYAEIADGIIEVTQDFSSDPAAPSNRAGEKGQEVASEKTYLLPDYGVVYRTEGYTASGELKDMEHNFFVFNEDSVLYMQSSHYRNLQYSSAYDISFLEHSDIFYKDFKIETSLNLKK